MTNSFDIERFDHVSRHSDFSEHYDIKWLNHYIAIVGKKGIIGVNPKLQDTSKAILEAGGVQDRLSLPVTENGHGIAYDDELNQLTLARYAQGIKSPNYMPPNITHGSYKIIVLDNSTAVDKIGKNDFKRLHDVMPYLKAQKYLDMLNNTNNSSESYTDFTNSLFTNLSDQGIDYFANHSLPKDLEKSIRRHNQYFIQNGK